MVKDKKAQVSEADKKKGRARNNAYSLLRMRPRSEREIRQRLKLKGYGSETINTVVEELVRLGEIDDKKFAKFWMESRMHLNPVGDVVLRHELKEKGISDSLIEDTLEAKHAAYDEYEVAQNLASESFERFKKIDRRKAIKRLYGQLLQRGFAYDVICRVIEELTGKSSPSFSLNSEKAAEDEYSKE